MNTLKSVDNRGGMLRTVGLTLSGITLAGMAVAGCSSSTKGNGDKQSAPVTPTKSNPVTQPTFAPRPALRATYPACSKAVIDRAFPNFHNEYDTVQKLAAGSTPAVRVQRTSATILDFGTYLNDRGLTRQSSLGYRDATKPGYLDLVSAEGGNRLTVRFLYGNAVGNLCTALSFHAEPAGSKTDFTFDVQGYTSHRFADHTEQIVNSATGSIDPSEAADSATTVLELMKLLPNVQVKSSPSTATI